MSKKILRKVRDELVDIDTTDIFAAEAIKRCISLCDMALAPGDLPPHQVHSHTSRAAAVAIAPKFGAMTRDVLMLLSRYENGLTDQEGQRILQMPGDSYRPCRVTLADTGLVTDTGNTRKTPRNRPAIVWAITERGVLFLQGEGTPG